MQQQNFNDEDAEPTPPIFEEEEGNQPPIVTPPIYEHSVPWHKNPVVWVAIVSLLIAVIALIVYMRQRKFDF